MGSKAHFPGLLDTVWTPTGNFGHQLGSEYGSNFAMEDRGLGRNCFRRILARATVSHSIAMTTDELFVAVSQNLKRMTPEERAAVRAELDKAFPAKVTMCRHCRVEIRQTRAVQNARLMWEHARHRRGVWPEVFCRDVDGHRTGGRAEPADFVPEFTEFDKWFLRLLKIGG